MRYTIRTVAYLVIMLIQRIRNRTVRFEYASKAPLNTTFEGRNKLSHHAFFRGEMGFASYIGAYSAVEGKIGRFCSIAENVTFISQTHPVQEFVSSHPCFYSMKKQSGFTYATKQLFNESPKINGSKYSIEVGSDVYIGYGVLIIGPCKIGNGAVVAAGAVVTKDVPEFAIVGGVPARIIRYRFSKEQIDFLNKLKWWDRTPEWIQENASHFESIEEMMTYIDTDKE